MESGAQLCFIQLTALHASAAVLDTRQCGAAGDLREAVCTRLCSLGWPRKDDEQYLVDSLVTLLGMGVSWKDTPQVFQIQCDCVLRSTFAQIEFKLGTVNGISSPNAGQQAVHDQMQRARIWCMLRVAKEAHERYPKEYDPLQTRIRDAIKKPRMSTSPQLSSRPAAPASSDLCPSVPPCNAASTRSTPQQVNSDQTSSPSFWNLVPLIASCELPCISLHKAWMGEKRLIIRAQCAQAPAAAERTRPYKRQGGSNVSYPSSAETDKSRRPRIQSTESTPQVNLYTCKVDQAPVAVACVI